MQKLDKIKVFRDPIYGFIKVEYKVIMELIDTPEFQRLRRIHQLSGVLEVFPTAEHSRFTHSLGTYECARLILSEVCGASSLSEYEQVLFLVTSLLHDIGHGPYSHAFESITKLSHESLGALIIESRELNIRPILQKNNICPEDVTNILLHKGKYPLLETLTSSQVDVDRMDYLVRDAYFTGATYGVIDRDRIIKSMIIKDNKLYFKESSVNSLESYIMARYHMYWQVYYHKAAKGYDLLLETLYIRIYELYKEGLLKKEEYPDFLNFLDDNNDIKSYVILDDGYISSMVKKMLRSEDDILRDLAYSIESRRLFKCIEVEDTNCIDALNKKYSKLPSGYKKIVTVSQVAYLDSNSGTLNSVLILKNDGSVIDLVAYSKIIEGLILSGKRKVIRYYYKERLLNIWKKV